MLFFQALFAFLAVGVMSVFAAPSPTFGKGKDDIYDVFAALNTLERSNNVLIPTIDALLDGPDSMCNEATLLPLLNTLVYNVDVATIAFNGYRGKHLHHHKKDDVAKKVSKIIERITIVIYKIKTRRPTLYVLVVKCGLEVALQKFCLAVDFVVSGTIGLIGIPLKGVFGRLIGLKWKLFEGLFGWHF